MSKNTRRNVWKDSRLYFVGLLFFVSIGLIAQLYMIQILPLKYNLIITVIILVLFLLMWLLQYNKKVSKFNKTLGKIIIVILCFLLGAGNYYVYKGGSTLRGISGANIKTDAISVVVMKDTKAENVEDLKGTDFGILKMTDRENTDKAINDIENKLDSSITTIEYGSPFELAEALYNGNVKSIILNEAYRGTFQDNEENLTYKNIDSETKVIYQIELESEMEDISKNVNVTNAPFNVFISGIDTYGPVSATSRSDVNMLATVNPITNKVLLTSIPRDYYVAQSCQGGQLDKLTHAGIYGVGCSVDSMEALFGIDINYYARVNFSSLISIVDALGGIEVDNPNAFTASDGTYSYPVGILEMDGAKALRFSRERYAFSGGDRERGKNQMRVINGIIAKAVSPSIITNYSGVMNAISGSFETNMETSDITKFIQKQLNSMKGWEVIQNSVDGTGGTDWTPANGFNAYVMYPDQATLDNAKNMISQVMSGN